MDKQRRHFLKISSLTVGGFALSMSLTSRAFEVENQERKDIQEITQGVEILPDGRITIRVFKQEMGHGIATGLAMAVAEEMNANWDDVSVRQMKYATYMQPEKKIHRYDTGGSSGIFTEYEPMRVLGATVGNMLVRAAAKKWKIDSKNCECSHSIVKNKLTGEVYNFGQLAVAAAAEEVIEITDLKPVEQFTIVGKPIAANKNQHVVNGNLQYSMDINFPNMLYAMIIRPPSLGGKVLNYETNGAEKDSGIVDIYVLDPIQSETLFFKGVRGGVVVVGNSTWACIEARKKIQVQWSETANSNRDSQSLYKELDNYRKTTEGSTTFESGDIKKGILAPTKIVKAQYTSPYIAHGLMESLNAIAQFKLNGKLDIWVGTQSPFETTNNISKTLKIDKNLITIHPQTMGGGYGRRYFSDYVIETVLVAKRYKQAVKLIWSREDEIQFALVHPLRKDYCACGLDEKGKMKSFAIDAVTTHEWGGMELPWFYSHENLSFKSWFYQNKLLQWGSWRAVVMHLDVFSRESFLDEVAYAAGVDPLAYRIQHLKLPIPTGNSEKEQKQFERLTDLRRHHLRSFELIKKLSNWNGKRPNNVGLGVATIAYHDKSICTQVAEVSVNNNKVKVDKVYCVADVGFTVNPNLVKGQIESSILWGLTPVLHGGVDVKNGAIVQDNFDTMPLARMYESPEIIIHLEDFENRKPSGAGEFAVPPTAPAVLNAVFAATGKRIRTMNLPKEMTM